MIRIKKVFLDLKFKERRQKAQDALRKHEKELEDKHLRQSKVKTDKFGNLRLCTSSDGRFLSTYFPKTFIHNTYSVGFTPKGGSATARLETEKLCLNY